MLFDTLNFFLVPRLVVFNKIGGNVVTGKLQTCFARLVTYGIGKIRVILKRESERRNFDMLSPVIRNPLNRRKKISISPALITLDKLYVLNPIFIVLVPPFVNNSRDALPQ